MSLFLETPSLCLYYYPELVPDGSARKKTIQDTRNRYNDNLNTLFHKIEFVGMPIYKEETTRGVPMEDIYIPLTVVPEGADEKTTSSRINPLSFLGPGARTVILGDPGSGKSTLLKFLALAGLSSSLQTRYNATPDERQTFYQKETWEKVEDSFEKENAGKAEEYLAASLLILDTFLFIYGYHKSEDESIFKNLADLTGEIDAPPLRIAHCIRNLAYGDESHIEDLVSMVRSDNPEYQEIFEAALWRSRSK